MANNTTNDQKDTSKNTTQSNDTSTRDNDPHYGQEPHTIDPNRADPDEEVTPRNIQTPVSDADKDKQNDVLAADHVRAGYPANMEPRTSEERERMEDEGLIDKAK